jgi:hypothetical protein
MSCGCKICQKKAQKTWNDKAKEVMAKCKESEKSEREDLVTVDIDIADDVLLYLALEAHKADMKLNDYMVMLLEDYIKRNEMRKDFQEGLEKMKDVDWQALRDEYNREVEY